ncbi:hypothetical protein [Paenibacillus sp. 32352]|uniref:hypothetical protein n=1 Tax=Paenibacillus sp. 32352 TaxID=1969111 RepID=UPI0009AE495A|nr:hypothetical protein [Paenibacillus sp. 32352]
MIKQHPLIETAYEVNGQTYVLGFDPNEYNTVSHVAQVQVGVLRNILRMKGFKKGQIHKLTADLIFYKDIDDVDVFVNEFECNVRSYFAKYGMQDEESFCELFPLVQYANSVVVSLRYRRWVMFRSLCQYGVSGSR